MNDRWSQLSMSEKSDLMSLYIRNGISSLEEIKKHYNNYQDGGRVDNNPDKDPVLKDRKPKANFYQRLLNPFRQTIPDWKNRINGRNDVATHKMSWATDNNGTAIVYPKVQEIDGKLYDFTDPRNKAGEWDALNRAIETGDTIQMTPEQANFWTQHYKEFYPSFDFATGGHLYQDGGSDEPNFVGGATALKKNYDYALEHLAEKYPVTAEGPWHDYGIHNPSPSQRAHWNELSKMYNRVSERPNYQRLNPINIAEYAPIVGDAIDMGNSIYDLQQGNTGLGLAGLGMLALPNIIEKPLKAGVKRVKKLFKNKSDKAFNKYWNQLQDAQQSKAPTVHVISEPSVEITKPIFKHSLTNYNPERYPFEVSSPLGLTHTVSGKDLAKIIEYSDGRLPAPSIAISSWDGIRTGRAPYPVHYDDGRYTFYFRPDYIDDMPHEAYEFDMFTPTYKNAETWAGRLLNPTEVVDTKRQMFNEFGTLLDLQRGYDLKGHKKLTDTDNYRLSQSLQEAAKALKKSPNRDYGEIMPLSFVDLRQAPLIVGEGSENPLVLDFLKRLNTHKVTTPELFNIKGLALKNGGRLK